MKKKPVLTVVIIFLVCLFLLPLSACAKPAPYESAVSEVKYNQFYVKSTKATLNASSGFREFPLDNDMTTGTLKYYISFKIIPADGNMDKVYSITFTLGGKSYGDTFSEDEVYHTLVCTIVIDKCEDFSSLGVVIKTTDWTESATLVSVRPENTADYKAALKAAAAVLEDVFAEHTEGGKLNGEIRIRLIVKDATAYWYIGFHYSKTECISLLLDGETLKLLARRDQG